MLNLVAERTLARLLMVGSTFITIFVVWGAVTDPVNVTKLLVIKIKYLMKRVNAFVQLIKTELNIMEMIVKNITVI